MVELKRVARPLIALTASRQGPAPRAASRDRCMAPVPPAETTEARIPRPFSKKSSRPANRAHTAATKKERSVRGVRRHGSSPLWAWPRFRFTRGFCARTSRECFQACAHSPAFSPTAGPCWRPHLHSPPWRQISRTSLNVPTSACSTVARVVVGSVPGAPSLDGRP